MLYLIQRGIDDPSELGAINPDHAVGIVLLILAVGGFFSYLIHIGYFDELIRHLKDDDEGQDIAEYAVLLAVILVIVIGTIRLIGSGANNTFSAVASSLTDGAK